VRSLIAVALSSGFSDNDVPALSAVNSAADGHEPISVGCSHAGISAQEYSHKMRVATIQVPAQSTSFRRRWPASSRTLSHTMCSSGQMTIPALVSVFHVCLTIRAFAHC